MVPSLKIRNADGNWPISYVDPTGLTAWVDYIPVGSLLNGSFEVGLATGWDSAQEGVTGEAGSGGSLAKAGSDVMELAVAVGFTNNNTPDFPCSPLEDISVSGYIRPRGVPNALGHIYLLIDDAQGARVGTHDLTSNSADPNSDTWQFYAITATSPANADNWRIYLENSPNAAPVGDWWYDQICAGKASDKNRYEQRGWIPASVITTPSASQRAWVDYIPVVFVNNSDNGKRWTTASNGFIPIVEIEVI